MRYRYLEVVEPKPMVRAIVDSALADKALASLHVVNPKNQNEMPDSPDDAADELFFTIRHTGWSLSQQGWKAIGFTPDHDSVTIIIPEDESEPSSLALAVDSLLEDSDEDETSII